MHLTTILTKLVSYPFVIIIKAYQMLISPFLGQNCRFYPSCSHYAQQAIQMHGPITGMLLAGRRITKCHPYNEGGFDPVPKAPLVFKKFKPYIHKKSLINKAKTQLSIDEQRFNDN